MTLLKNKKGAPKVVCPESSTHHPRILFVTFPDESIRFINTLLSKGTIWSKLLPSYFSGAEYFKSPNV